MQLDFIDTYLYSNISRFLEKTRFINEQPVDIRWGFLEGCVVLEAHNHIGPVISITKRSFGKYFIGMTFGKLLASNIDSGITILLDRLNKSIYEGTIVVIPSLSEEIDLLSYTFPVSVVDILTSKRFERTISKFQKDMNRACDELCNAKQESINHAALASEYEIDPNNEEESDDN